MIDHSKESNWHALAFQGVFAETPVIVADMQTHWGGETAGLRMQNLSTSGVELKLEEDKSVDNEGNHLAENVGYLALSRGLIRNAAGDTIGEAGSLSARTTENADWESLELRPSPLDIFCGFLLDRASGVRECMGKSRRHLQEERRRR